VALVAAPAVFEMPARRALGNTGLLDVIDRLPGGGDAARRWAFGLTWMPWQCGRLQTRSIDCSITDLDTDDIDDWPEIREQPAFSLWDAIMCSTMGMPVDYLTNRLENHMDTLLSAAFARELISGDASGGHSLVDDAVTLGAYANPRDALAVVIDGLEVQLQGAQGLIHMTPGTLSQVVGHLTRSGSSWETANGHKVVADAGYIDDDEPDEVSAATIYGTGPVYYEADSFDYIGDANGPESIDFVHNLRTIFGQRFGILVWDPCPVVSATTNVGTVDVG
jgi:hypothetical protein